MIRQPIVAVLGHVDHGKTTLLDRIRGSGVANKEAGGITQHIGATEIPLETIKDICGGLVKQLNLDLTIPGLLFIDTPGHEAFTTLRKRGGALSDFAILVVDINEGFKPQTLESIEILKTYKTPFLLAANKIDKTSQWVTYENYPFAHSFSKQNKKVQQILENKIYNLVGQLYDLGFESERYDRIKKFGKQIAIVPMSGKTGEGIPELLMLLTGLAQKFLGKKLDIDTEKPANGTILEVKEEIGLGTTIDVIIYEGKIKVGDTIVLGGKRGIVTTRVRSLLKPKPLDEIRDPKFRFDHIKEVHASAGVKISAPNLGDALAGSPLVVAGENVEETEEEVEKEIESIKVETEKEGVVVKADTLGSLEALVKIFTDAKIPIRYADVGDITKRDIIEAEAVKEEDHFLGVVLGFNVKTLKNAEERSQEKNIKVILRDVIYRLIDDYKDYVEMEKALQRIREFDILTKPAKIEVLRGYVFRASKPAVVGVDILAGTLKPKVRLININDEKVGVVKGIQDRNKNIGEATKGMQVAVSIEGATVGKNLKEGDIVFTDIYENEAKLINQKYKEFLREDEDEVFQEFVKIKRKSKPFWAKSNI